MHPRASTPASRLLLFAALVVLGAMTACTRQVRAPAWAYPILPDSTAVVPMDPEPRHVPDSQRTFVQRELTNRNGAAPDWHPEDHPKMPPVVAQGRQPDVLACGYCHLPDGSGRPENASLSGLTFNYLRAQLLAFRQGQREGSVPTRGPQVRMIALTKPLTDAEIDAAATYFAAIPPRSYQQVIETDEVPVTKVAGWILTPEPGNRREPLGARIVETSADYERFENRDSRNPYLIYVPRGSVARGRELVTTGAGGRIPTCASCHGPELKGLADVPRLAGRSPSFLMRQLCDIRNGTRSGGPSELMKPIVAALSEDDMTAIVAYLASLKP